MSVDEYEARLQSWPHKFVSLFLTGCFVVVLGVAIYWATHIEMICQLGHLNECWCRQGGAITWAPVRVCHAEFLAEGLIVQGGENGTEVSEGL